MVKIILKIKRLITFKKVRILYKLGKNIKENEYYLLAHNKNKTENSKIPNRTEIINYLVSTLNKDCTYLEIGVRNPEDNFDLISATQKYSVDPGYESKINHATFKMESDDFFYKIREKELFDGNIAFDIIFIDGLHLAEQVDKDINNSLDFITDEGYIVIHDCNPPTVWHARENVNYTLSPAGWQWNGTVWKAFLKWRGDKRVNSCCVDSDWGVGVLSKSKPIGKHIIFNNQFFEFTIFDKNRKEYLNLIKFEELKQKIKIKV